MEKILKRVNSLIRNLDYIGSYKRYDFEERMQLLSELEGNDIINFLLDIESDVLAEYEKFDREPNFD